MAEIIGVSKRLTPFDITIFLVKIVRKNDKMNKLQFIR